MISGAMKFVERLEQQQDTVWYFLASGKSIWQGLKEGVMRFLENPLGSLLVVDKSRRITENLVKVQKTEAWLCLQRTVQDLGTVWEKCDFKKLVKPTWVRFGAVSHWSCPPLCSATNSQHRCFPLACYLYLTGEEKGIGTVAEERGGKETRGSQRHDGLDNMVWLVSRRKQGLIKKGKGWEGIKKFVKNVRIGIEEYDILPTYKIMPIILLSINYNFNEYVFDQPFRCT